MGFFWEKGNNNNFPNMYDYLYSLMKQVKEPYDDYLV